MRTKPLKFDNVEELQAEIDEYFEKTDKSEWTITGLAMALDTTRDVLIDYENENQSSADKEESKKISNALIKAKLKVENGYEIDLKKYGRSGTIFALKNFKWRDSQEITGANGKDLFPQPILDVSKNNSD